MGWQNIIRFWPLQILYLFYRLRAYLLQQVLWPRFYMLSAAINNGKVFWLVIVGIICAAISVYYYFRVIQAMYFKEGEKQEIECGPGFTGLLAGTAAFIIFLGIFPQWLIEKMYYFF